MLRDRISKVKQSASLLSVRRNWFCFVYCTYFHQMEQYNFSILSSAVCQGVLACLHASCIHMCSGTQPNIPCHVHRIIICRVSSCCNCPLLCLCPTLPLRADKGGRRRLTCLLRITSLWHCIFIDHGSVHNGGHKCRYWYVLLLSF